jgi:hypothetical protein
VKNVRAEPMSRRCDTYTSITWPLVHPIHLPPDPGDLDIGFVDEPANHPPHADRAGLRRPTTT